jgi:sialic acid synthase SpsE
MSIHIIAEGCTNHDGNPEKAKALILAAKQAGADSVKFQMINPEALYICKLRQEGEMVDNPVIARRKLGQLSDSCYKDLAAFSVEAGLPLSASVFDTHGLKLLDSLSPPYIKIASCDINNLPLLAEAARYDRPLILSTGMAGILEVEKALDTVAKNGSPRVILLHCVSIYPAPLESTNLAMIPLLHKHFGLEVGFSDHTLGSAAAIAALALGATWFEKHFTLNTADEGVDHAHSTPPGLLAEYVGVLRQTEKACAAQAVKVGESETNLRAFARRGLYAARDLQAGETLREGDVLIVRPEAALKPTDMPRITGRELAKAVNQYEPLSEDLFQ